MDGILIVGDLLGIKYQRHTSYNHNNKSNNNINIFGYVVGGCGLLDSHYESQVQTISKLYVRRQSVEMPRKREIEKMTSSS